MHERLDGSAARTVTLTMSSTINKWCETDQGVFAGRVDGIIKGTYVKDAFHGSDIIQTCSIEKSLAPP